MSNLDPKLYKNGKAVTTDEKGEPTLVPAPKVAAGGITSAVVVVVAAVLAAVTPDLLAFAGPWAPVLFAGVAALAGFVASYAKRP